MIIDYKIGLGIITILIGIVSYSFYFRDIFNGRTRPEGYSWLIWSVLAAITFFAQITNGGGAGAWATAFTSAACFIIAVVTFSRGGEHIKLIDKISLAGAAIAIGLWYLTKDPLLGVFLAISVGALGFVPTFRKVFKNPNEETAITYLLNACKFVLAIFALKSLTPVTWLYPMSLIFMNVSLAATIFLKR